MNEEVAGQNYLRTLLEADAELGRLVSGVWLRTTSTKASMPVIKIDRQEGNDLIVVGLKRVWADLAFLVRGIDRWTGSGAPDWTAAGQIADRIDAVLHDHEGTDGVVNVHSFREESFTDETIEDGSLYLHAGGIYRVRVAEA